MILKVALKEMKFLEFWKLDTIGIADPSQTLSKAKAKEFQSWIFIKEVDTYREDCYSDPWKISLDKRQKKNPSNRHMA